VRAGQVESAGEDAEIAQQRLLTRTEEGVAPLDDCAERGMAGFLGSTIEA
jgi:hypothetical protein